VEDSRVYLTIKKKHTAMSVSAVRESARSTAAEAIEIQKEEFRSLAVMADWDASAGVYITMSKSRHLDQADWDQMPISRCGKCVCSSKWYSKVSLSF
jgi:isoleucyl-tRNA synthetase